MIQVIHYLPDVPMYYRDPVFAFQDAIRPQVAAVIRPDPLGPVNRVVQLVAGRQGDPIDQCRIVKQTLTHIPDGADITVRRDPGTPTVRYWDRDWIYRASQEGRPASWYVTVNGRRVLEAAAVECLPPDYRPPLPLKPKGLWRNLLGLPITGWFRTLADRVADRCGYRRDELGGDW